MLRLTVGLQFHAIVDSVSQLVLEEIILVGASTHICEGLKHMIVCSGVLIGPFVLVDLRDIEGLRWLLKKV
jgi:hypothetical protein